jgi:hypothetical protein
MGHEVLHVVSCFGVWPRPVRRPSVLPGTALSIVMLSMFVVRLVHHWGGLELNGLTNKYAAVSNVQHKFGYRRVSCSLTWLLRGGSRACEDPLSEWIYVRLYLDVAAMVPPAVALPHVVDRLPLLSIGSLDVHRKTAYV